MAETAGWDQLLLVSKQGPLLRCWETATSSKQFARSKSFKELLNTVTLLNQRFQFHSRISLNKVTQAIAYSVFCS